MEGVLSKRRIALVGGAGFIGHNLALQLKAQGAEVSVVDSLQVNNLLAFMGFGDEEGHGGLYVKMLHERMDLLRRANIPLFVQDARDYHALGRILNEIQPDSVILLAAVAHANKSNKDPFSTFDHSLRTLENALDWARGNVEHFVYFSSSMVYGNFPNGFVTEETNCEPLGIYGSLKYAGEKIVQAYNQVFGLPYTIIRPSALYGERCVSRRVIQIFIENALEGKEVSVSGDGSDRLDFTYIDDLVHGVSCVLTNQKSKGETFNLTYGESRSIADVAEIVREEFPDLELKFQARDKLMPSRGTLSVEKARKLIGYSPKYSIDEGVRKYIRWYKEFAGKREDSATSIIEASSVARPGDGPLI